MMNFTFDLFGIIASLIKTNCMKKILFYVLVLTMISCGSKGVKSTDAAATTDANKPAQTKTTAKKTEASQSTYKPKNEGWYVNLDMALDESKKTGKPIMANFTGSDWCGWCKRLDKSVFHQPGFEKWADDNVVLLELDFPRRFKLPTDIATQNRTLQQQLGVRGYPTIWLFDADKNDQGQIAINALGKTGYTKTLGEFQSKIEGYISNRG